MTADALVSGPQLAGQTVVVIGGSAGMGLETARRARREGADVIITARDHDRLHRAGLELGASIAAFDATDFDRLARFFGELRSPIDHVLRDRPRPPLHAAAGARRRGGAPRARRPPAPASADRPQRQRQGAPGRDRDLHRRHGWPPHGAGPGVLLRPHGSASGHDEEPRLELAPIRVNLIAAGFVDTPLSARSSATSSTPAASSFVPRSRSVASSGRTTSPRWPFTS